MTAPQRPDDPLDAVPENVELRIDSRLVALGTAILRGSMSPTYSRLDGEASIIAGVALGLLRLTRKDATGEDVVAALARAQSALSSVYRSI